MNKLTVLVDMDDTLENLCETWVGYLNERHGTNVHIDDVKEWDMTKAFPTLSKAELFAPLYEEELWKRVKPLPGSVEYVKRLLDDGHKVIVVTASHQNTVAYKLNNVLFRYFPFLTTNDVVVAYQKQLIRGDVLIDDAPHNLIGGEYKGILMNASHNKQFDAKAAGFIRVANWEEAYNTVRNIAEER